MFSGPLVLQDAVESIKMRIWCILWIVLGHIVTKRGIEANPTQFESISSLDMPKSMRDVQRLTGKIATLSRFISRMSDRCEPFFKSIKKNTSSLWGPEQEKAFIELKQYLSSPPILSSPLPEEDLLMYLVVSEVAVSVVLFREENKKQRHVFYVSRMLLDAETHYNAVEKMVLALVNAKKKLQHYFETHPITVITNFPIKQILSKPDLSGRPMKWAIDLGFYDIHYIPRAAKEGQIMADFLVEIQSFSAEPEHLLHTKEKFQTWVLSTDGASNSTGAGIEIILEAPSGLKIEEARRLSFQRTKMKQNMKL